MKIGHLSLSPHITASEEQLVILIESLAGHGVRQHAILRNAQLASRLAACRGVSVGPLASSPTLACCLMPDVDLAHAHDTRAIQTGLLLTLTRRVPYIMTYRDSGLPTAHALTRYLYQRAESIICPNTEVSTMLQNYFGNLSVATVPDVPVGSTKSPTRRDRNSDRLSAERMAAEYLRVYRRAVDVHSVPAMLL